MKFRYKTNSFLLGLLLVSFAPPRLGLALLGLGLAALVPFLVILALFLFFL